jgi:hypothetical protein
MGLPIVGKNGENLDDFKAGLYWLTDPSRRQSVIVTHSGSTWSWQLIGA